MAGAFALGEFGWAHENLLNHILSGQLPANNRVSAQILRAIQELAARLEFFQTAQAVDAGVESMVAAAEAIVAGEDEVTPVFQPALPPPVAEVNNSKIIASEGWLLDDEPEAETGATEPEDWLQDVVEPEVGITEAEDWLQDETGVAVPEWVEEEETEEVLDFTSPSPPIMELEPELQCLHADEVTPAVAMATDAEQDAETQLIWQLFWEEVPDQLQALDHNLQRLLDDPGDQEAIRELEREFHTLKGGARMAQLTDLADISHEAESLLNRLSGSGEADQALLDTLQASLDKLHALAESYQQGDIITPPEQQPEPVVAETVAAPEVVTVTLPVAEVDEAENTLTDSWAKLRVEQGEFSSLLERMLAEQAESLPDISVLGIPARTGSAVAHVAEDAGKQVKNHETIRLSASFIDHLIDRAVGLNVQQVRMSEYFNGMGGDVAELGRTVTRLRQQIRTLELETEAQIHDGRTSSSRSHSGGKGFDPLEMDQYAEIQRISRSLAESLNDLVNLEADLSGQLRKGEQLLQDDMRTTRQIQQELLETRLVALTMLVPRLRRLTRQTSTELGKQVTLEVQGEECELDRNLLQNMTAPLEHLIRNAVSHGLETPEERERLGKPAAGTITLGVSRDDAEIVMRFRDDGKGLDRQKLLKRGRELGFIQPGQTLPDSELDRLILRAGFSTADAVSQISGRGIGMDVVNSELKALGGSLQIESTPGQGTEFIMRLPFTMVVNPVLLAEVHGQIFALPMSGIQGLARIAGGEIRKLLASGEKQLEFAGELYQLRQLAEQLGAGAVHEFAEEDMFPVVFFILHGQSIAWVIERIKGRREVVLQPLGVLFNECRLYSAATVSPDGSVYLVPDMAELARRVAQADAVPADALAGETLPDAPDSPAGSPRIMVVDDSVTVRRVTEKFLNAQEYVVATAKDGMEALERVGEFQPDAVLLDIEMPRMDGFELLGHLRRDPQWRSLPVIMISSRTAPKHREHALSLGATSFLGKPYQNEILLDTLQGVLVTGHNPHGEHVSA
ncbi:MAG: response regulator [Gammaproteobacteria bacterium]|nr:response regulator [Gammaproteobacteria bacterium]MBU1725065.1 response regulator [Gammaproteobacteria bacterium]MBU2007213.1 response regulator [Gammaproteobacteria bacterium]